MMPRPLLSFFAAILCALSMVGPVHADAVDPPDSLSIPSAFAYTHVFEEGGAISDLLVLINYDIAYTTLPSLPVDSTYLAQLLAPDGVTVIKTTSPVPFNDNGYNAGSVALYLDPDEVVAASISYGDALQVRITGNPTIFSSPISVTLSSVLWRPASAQPGFWLSRDIMTRSAVLQSLWGVPLIQSTVGATKLTATGEAYWTLVIIDARTAAPQAFVDTLVAADFSTTTFTDDYQDALSGAWNGKFLESSLNVLGPTGNIFLWIAIEVAMVVFLLSQWPDQRYLPIVCSPILFAFGSMAFGLNIILAVIFGVASVFILGWVLLGSKSFA